MSLVLIIFKPFQPSGMYESSSFNDAHIAISQYKNNRAMWFDRVPHVGEIVTFPAPQGRSVVFFRVAEVQHLPSEPDSLPATTSTPQSVIFLQAMMVK